MLDNSELKSIGIGSGLVLLNIALMMVFARTFLADVNNYLWSAGAIVGVIVYGILLTGGSYLGRRGIKNNDTGTAGLGISLLMLAYGSFGGGIISGLDAATQIVVLGITAVLTTILAVAAGLYVYWTDRNLSKTGMYANYAFLGVLGTAFIGTFVTPVLLLAFFLALAGFLLYLVYEVWRMKTEAVSPMLTGLGLYIAYAGVFVQILQLVARSYLEE